MFKYKIFVSDSSIHGKGLFTNEFIQKGSVIWSLENNSIEDKIDIIDCSRLLVLESCYEFEKVKDILLYSIYKKGKFYYYLDENKYINHSLDSNAFTQEDFSVISTRDINIGEEITENYNTYYKDNLLLMFYKKYDIEL